MNEEDLRKKNLVKFAMRSNVILLSKDRQGLKSVESYLKRFSFKT